MPSDVILTGIPRSGTTLTAALIDSLSDAICLNEPEWQVTLLSAARDPQEFVEKLGEDFRSLRTKLLAGELVADRRDTKGRALTNYYRREEGKMIFNWTLTPAAQRPLTPDFLLAIKHNALYFSVLPEVVQSGIFKVIAIIRHPVPTILSWRSLKLPISEGRLPAAERFWEDVKRTGELAADILTRQVRMYDLFCGRLRDLGESVKVVRYEEIIDHPEIFSEFFGRVMGDVPPIEDGSENRAYDWNEAEMIRERVRAEAPNAQFFYPE